MKRRTTVELTNMCFIYDEEKVLVQEKIGTGHEKGIVFPGGHVEQGESLQASVIREMKEETGLNIYNPKPCGFKDWICEDGTRYIVFLYKTNKFDGTLHDSSEGSVFWVNREELLQLNLIWNMRELVKIFETDEYSEFYFEYKNGKYEAGKLLG